MSKTEVVLKDAIEMVINEIEPCVKKVDFTVSADSLTKEFDSILKEFRQLADIPGFRKGKAPRSLVKKKFAEQIDEELLKRCYVSALEKTSDYKELDIISYLPLHDSNSEIVEGEDFNFSIDFNTNPEFELPEYTNLKVENPATDVDPKVIEERIEYYKNAYAEYKKVDSPAEADDMLKVSYTSDYELPEDASPTLKRQIESDENWIWISEPETIPGAIKELTGSEAGKEYEFKAQYVDDYREEELRGKSVNYKLKVIEVQRKQTIESDEALCEKMNLDSIDALKEQLENSIKVESDHKAETEMRTKVYETIESKIPEFPIPPSILQSETQKTLRIILQREVKSEEDAAKFKENSGAFNDEAKETAIKNMRRFFILNKIAKAENIVVENHEIDQQIKGMSTYYGYKEKELKKMLHESGSIDDLQIDILNNKVIDFLIEKAEISEPKKTEKK